MGLYAYNHIQKQNGRILVLILPFKFADFTLLDKARNAFLTRGFLPSDVAKVVQIFDLAKVMRLYFTKVFRLITQKADNPNRENAL